MLKNQELKLWRKKIMRYFLLLLFLGYYGSITLFNHTHIVNGVAIVHSHPYNPFSGKKPINHHHSTNEFIFIHFLSHFVTTFLAFFIALNVVRSLIHIIANRLIGNYKVFNGFYTFLLRAPPLNIHC